MMASNRAAKVMEPITLPKAKVTVDAYLEKAPIDKYVCPLPRCTVEYVLSFLLLSIGISIYFFGDARLGLDLVYTYGMPLIVVKAIWTSLFVAGGCARLIALVFGRFLFQRAMSFASALIWGSFLYTCIDGHIVIVAAPVAIVCFCSDAFIFALLRKS